MPMRIACGTPCNDRCRVQVAVRHTDTAHRHIGIHPFAYRYSHADPTLGRVQLEVRTYLSRSLHRTHAAVVDIEILAFEGELAARVQSIHVETFE